MLKHPLVLALGADDAGVHLKNALRDRLHNDPRVEIRDYGVSDTGDTTAYPNIGITVSEAVAQGVADRALLICGTGIGMAITANKVPGIRATVAHDSYSIERAVLSNNCQVLTFGARVIGPELAFKLIKEWLSYEFDPSSPSAQKVALISAYENRSQF